MPVIHQGQPIHLRLAQVAGAIVPDGVTETIDIARYRRDMALAADAFAALAEDRFQLVWQPVSPADGGGAPLYHEALGRIVDRGGEARSVADAIAALERLGLVRAFDRHVVSLVIAELERSPDAVLAANVSALSAVADHWWTSITERLAARPDVARRLVIEITESAALPSPGAATAFADAMRRLGCRIALDDFGVGHASIRQLIALAPDIVKIDAFFLRRAVPGEGDDAVLRHMIGLAGALAPEVVVEGVETPEQSWLVERIQREVTGGACWQQGYFLGRPAATRLSGDAVPDDGIAPILQFRPQSGFDPADGRVRWHRRAR